MNVPLNIDSSVLDGVNYSVSLEGPFRELRATISYFGKVAKIIVSRTGRNGLSSRRQRFYYSCYFYVRAGVKDAAKSSKYCLHPFKR